MPMKRLRGENLIRSIAIPSINIQAKRNLGEKKGSLGKSLSAYRLFYVKEQVIVIASPAPIRFRKEYYFMQENENVETEIQNRPDGSFTMKIGRTTYEVVLHFSKTSKATLDDKVKNLIRQDIKDGNY